VSALPPLGDVLSLQGKVALVTGGAGGIGAAVIARLLESGARVACLDRPGSRQIEGATTLPCDLRDPSAIETSFSSLDATFGRLDILVHAAGITRDGVLWKLSDDDWTDVMRVNLDAAFHVVRAAAPRMRRAGGGSIVLISSINGERGKFGQANYAASKAGLIGLARTAARELGGFGVRVNVVAPGFIRTAMTEALPADVRERAVAETVLARVGEPDDVARAALFLVSDLARHVTGQVLRVDGGQLIG